MTAMPKLRPRNLRTLAVVALALPVVMGPGRCGFVLDYTETLLITEKLDRVVLGADDGSVVATMYDREATLLKRHTFTFEPSLETVSNVVEDGALQLEARCKYEGNCRFDHMFELPLGIAVEIEMLDSQISLGYIDSDIDVKFASGWFKGVQLAAPNFNLELELGDVTAEFVAPPESVVIAVGEGDVELKVPAGSYRCVFAAGGEVDDSGVTCDDAATAVLDVQVETGDLKVEAI